MQDKVREPPTTLFEALLRCSYIVLYNRGSDQQSLGITSRVE